MMYRRQNTTGLFMTDWTYACQEVITLKFPQLNVNHRDAKPRLISSGMKARTTKEIAQQDDKVKT